MGTWHGAGGRRRTSRPWTQLVPPNPLLSNLVGGSIVEPMSRKKPVRRRPAQHPKRAATPPVVIAALLEQATRDGLIRASQDLGGNAVQLSVPPAEPSLPVASGTSGASVRPKTTSGSREPRRARGRIGAAEVDEDRDPLPHGVAPSFEFDSREIAPLRAVRFIGTRRSAAPGGGHSTFEVFQEVPPLPPQVGRVTVSAKVHPLEPGVWSVWAEPIPVDTSLHHRRQRSGLAPLEQQFESRMYPFVHAPGVYPWAWPALVLLGVLGATVLQALLVRRAGGDQGLATWTSIAATVVGYLAAKAWYMKLHHTSARAFITAGTCIQGFLLGAFGTIAAVAAVSAVDVPRLLDLTAPGVLLAMAVGRPGCWLGGCCAGRPTPSRFGVFSSDRAIGVRRVPVQLVEAALALGIGLGALLDVTLNPEGARGAIALGSVSLYTLGRQLLFRLRAERRRTRWGATITGLVAAVALLISVTLQM